MLIVDYTGILSCLNRADALQKSYFIDKVWAAWGDLIDSRDYLGNTLFDIQDTIEEAEWYHLGTTTRWGYLVMIEETIK